MKDARTSSIETRSDAGTSRVARSGRHAGAFAITLAVLLALVALAWFRINAPDYWWHLANGKHTLETGSFHFADPFAHTSEGRSYPPTQWAWEVVTYLLHDAFGPAGTIALKLAILAATFAILGSVMLRLGASLPLTLALLFAGLLLARFRFVIRPDLVTYLGLAIVWSIVLRFRAAADESRGGANGPGRAAAGDRLLRLLPVVTLVWVQFHSGVLFGILTLAGILVGEELAARFKPAWNTLDRARRKRLLVWTLAAFAASFVNPNHVSYVSFAIGHVQDYAKFAIVELRPMAWEHDRWRMLWIAGAGILAIAARRDPVSLVVLAPIAFITLRTARLFPLFLVLSLPWVARSLSPRLASVPARAAAGVAALALAVVIVRSAPTEASRGLYQWGTGINERLAPVAAAEALERIDPAGRMFNSNLYGGYLIWHFDGARKVFTDGRSQLHEPTLTFIGSHDWKEIIAEYGIGHALIDYRWAEPRLPDAEDMSLVWYDDNALLYVSRGEVLARELPYYRYVHPVTGVPPARLNSERAAIADELARALREAPGSVTAHLQAAAFAAEDRRFGQAEHFLTEALDLEPWRADIVRNRGYVLGRAGRREESAADLERSLDMEEDAGAYAALGRLHFDAGEKDRAIEAFEHAIDEDPNRADIALDFGYVLEQSGRNDDALALYRDYAARFPENPAFRDRLGGR